MKEIFTMAKLNQALRSKIQSYFESGDLYFLEDDILICPGFCDVHVHFREPGFCYKETVVTGSLASARGGYTTVMTMPNLNPVPDSLENLRPQLEAIEKAGIIEVIPYGAITCGQRGNELSDMSALAPHVCAFSDDGRGVQSEKMMERAMLNAKRLGKLVVAHCEDNSLLCGGYIHDGEYARTHGHRGICSESEFGPIARDVDLLKKTGASYHVCHVSTKESVQIIRRAKAEGVDITCETAPHYLTFTDSDLKEEGRFKMNPPIRGEEDRQALVDGVIDGTIDMIATDHAPHSAEEKAKGLSGSAFGVVGIETAFSALYTDLVKSGKITLGRLLELLVLAPRKRFNVPLKKENFTVFDLGASYEVDPSEFLSKGRATPYEGCKVFGRCLLTVHNGKIAFSQE